MLPIFLEWTLLIRMICDFMKKTNTVLLPGEIMERIIRSSQYIALAVCFLAANVFASGKGKRGRAPTPTAFNVEQEKSSPKVIGLGLGTPGESVRHVSWGSDGGAAHATGKVVELAKTPVGADRLRAVSPMQGEAPNKRVRSGSFSGGDVGAGSSVAVCAAVLGAGDGRPRSPGVARRRGGSFSIAPGEDVDPYAMKEIETHYLLATNDENVNFAVRLLKEGNLVALPTETVYGLGADAGNPDAVEKIFFAKKRPVDHPLIVHIALPLGEYKDFAEKKRAVRDVLSFWAKDVSEEVVSLGAKFWPGPLTMILKKNDDVDRVVTGGRDTIGIRIPAHDTFLTVLRRMGPGAGIAAPSANLHKQTSPTKAAHVVAGMAGRISAVLDAGPCTFGLESTILDPLARRIVRPGPITKKKLEDFLVVAISDSVAKIGGASGCMREHYQPPNTRAQLMTLEDIKRYIEREENAGKRFGLVVYSGEAASPSIFSVKKLANNSVEYGRDIFDAILELDTLGLDKILIQAPPTSDEWKAVNNRLGLATHGTSRG